MSAKQDDAARPHATALQLVAEALREVRFGTITLTIHDGRVTVVDATKRTKLPLPE